MSTSKYKPEYCQIALEKLGEGKTIVALAAYLDVTRRTVYSWFDEHPEFREAADRGLAKAQALWEQIGQDGATGNIERFNVASWIFTMKNRFREDYAEDKDANALQERLVEKLLDKLID